MKRLCSLVVLLVLGSSAHAGESISFSVGGHRIRIEAPRNCRSASCASVSISGIYESRRRRDFDDDRDVAPQPAPVSAQVSPPPAPPQQNKPVIAAAAPPPAVAPVASAPAVGFATAAAGTKPVAAPPPLPPVPPPPLVQTPKPVTQPCVAPSVEKPLEVLPPPPAPATPPLIKALQEEESSDTPVGDWQTENKGAVRIAQCGRALCGYTINASSNDKGEAVLINMKPKTDLQWSGSVYSRDSGDTYYGTMDLKAPNTLRVEACAFGHFYCTGNNWTRITTRPEPMITSRQVASQPRS